MGKNKRDYYSIHCHSEFSNLKIIDSINRYERTIDYAWDLGLSGAAMTEHDTISGAVKYIEAYEKKLEKEWRKLHPEEEELPSYKEISEELSFKPILGNEIYLTSEGMNKDNMDSSQFYHLILLAKDAEGFKQIKQLSSEAWKRAWVRVILRTPTYPSDLFKYVKGGHLICSTACLGGYVAKTVAKIIECEESEDKDFYINKLENHLQQMEELFGKGNFFIELQPNKAEEYGLQQIKFNRYMIDHYWGRYPFIFSTDAHYLNADEREVHKEFLNSKTSNDREVDEFYRYAYIMSEDEVWELMSAAGVTKEQFDEMANNTKKIMDMCEYYSLKQKQVITKVKYENYDKFENDIEIFNDVDEEKYPNFSYYLKSKDKTDHYFIMMIAHGFIKHYDNNWDIETYYNRLEEELWTIREVSEKVGQNMADYFISMAKMIDIMWNEAGSIVGPSRGSAGALLINYLFGITQMDPIKMNLPFVWRFLHPSRPELADIDVDTESDKRAKVFSAVQKYFKSIGGDLVNICTFGTEGTKSAIKTAGRGLNIDDDEISYITSMVKNERGFDWTLHDCYYGNGEDRKPIAAFKEEMDKNPKLWKLAQAIEGLVTRLGVHASGVVAINGDFTDYNSFMKTSKGQIVSAFDLHSSEFCGLVKYDFLTVSALDRIHQTLNYMLEDETIKWQGNLRDTYEYYIGTKNLIYDDSKMWDLADDGKIISLFQLTY